MKTKLFLLAAAVVLIIGYAGITESPEDQEERGRMSEINRSIAESEDFGDGYRRGLPMGTVHRKLGELDLSNEELRALAKTELKSAGREERGNKIDWRIGFQTGFEKGVREERRRQRGR